MLTKRPVYVVNPDNFEIAEREVHYPQDHGAVTVYATHGRSEYVGVDRWAPTLKEAREKALVLIDTRLKGLQREVTALEAQKRVLQSS